MKPKTVAETVYTLDNRAFFLAGLDERLGSGHVEIAKQRGIDGAGKAEEYLILLSEEFSGGAAYRNRTTHQTVITEEQWRASSFYRSGKNGSGLQGKSLSSHLDFEKALIELIRRYQSKEGWPSGVHPEKKLLKPNGSICPAVLAEILKEINTKCPASADKMVSAALKH